MLQKSSSRRSLLRICAFLVLSLSFAAPPSAAWAQCNNAGTSIANAFNTGKQKLITAHWQGGGLQGGQGLKGFTQPDALTHFNISTIQNVLPQLGTSTDLMGLLSSMLPQMVTSIISSMASPASIISGTLNGVGVPGISSLMGTQGGATGCASPATTAQPYTSGFQLTSPLY